MAQPVSTTEQLINLQKLEALNQYMKKLTDQFGNLERAREATLNTRSGNYDKFVSDLGECFRQIRAFDDEICAQINKVDPSQTRDPNSIHEEHLSHQEIQQALAGGLVGSVKGLVTGLQGENPVPKTVAALEAKRDALAKSVEGLDAAKAAEQMDKWDKEEAEAKANKSPEEARQIIAAISQQRIAAKLTSQADLDKLKDEDIAAIRDGAKPLAGSVPLIKRVEEFRKNLKGVFTSYVDREKHRVSKKPGHGFMSGYDVIETLLHNGMHFQIDTKDSKNIKVKSFGFAPSLWDAVKDFFGSGDPMPAAQFTRAYYEAIIEAGTVKDEKTGKVTQTISMSTALEKPMILSGVTLGAGASGTMLRMCARAVVAAQMMGSEKSDLNPVNTKSLSGHAAGEFSLAHAKNWHKEIGHAKGEFAKIIAEKKKELGYEPNDTDQQRKEKGQLSDREILGIEIMGDTWFKQDTKTTSDIKPAGDNQPPLVIGEDGKPKQNADLVIRSGPTP